MTLREKKTPLRLSKHFESRCCAALVGAHSFSRGADCSTQCLQLSRLWEGNVPPELELADMIISIVLYAVVWLPKLCEGLRRGVGWKFYHKWSIYVDFLLYISKMGLISCYKSVLMNNAQHAKVNICIPDSPSTTGQRYTWYEMSLDQQIQVDKHV